MAEFHPESADSGRKGFRRPVALTGRATDSKSEGWGFESLLAWNREAGRDSKGTPERNPKVIRRSIAFLKDVQSELAQVSWPSLQQLWESTKIVLVAMILLAVIIGLFDLICARIISWIIH